MQKAYPFFFIFMIFTLLLVQLGIGDFSPGMLSQNFLWKEKLTSGYTNFRFMIGDRVFPKVVIGKDGWMFFNEDGSLADYQRTLRLDEAELGRSQLFFSQMDARIRERGGRMLFVIAPDKSTIYPQFMPDEIPVIGGEKSRMDQFIDLMHANNSSVEILDLRPALLGASEDVQTYSKTDTHWNCYGAYYAYQTILNSLTDSYPSLQPHPLGDYRAELSEPGILDMPEALRLNHFDQRWKLEPNFSSGRLTRSEGEPFLGNTPKFVKNSKKDLPTALIFHDSNYIACLDFLIEGHFSKVTSFRVHHDDSYDELLKTWSEKEKADVVIVLTAERFLHYLVKETGKPQ